MDRILEVDREMQKHYIDSERIWMILSSLSCGPNVWMSVDPLLSVDQDQVVERAIMNIDQCNKIK